MNMDKILESLSNVIDQYDSSTYLTVDSLLEALRTLTRGIYHLTVIHTNASEAHNGVQYNFTGSAARGLIEADHEVPEYKMTRKILDACNRVQSAMIMELSIMKKEM
jgi:hypothetical protein